MISINLKTLDYKNFVRGKSKETISCLKCSTSIACRTPMMKEYFTLEEACTAMTHEFLSHTLFRYDSYKNVFSTDESSKMAADCTH